MKKWMAGANCGSLGGGRDWRAFLRHAFAAALLLSASLLLCTAKASGQQPESGVEIVRLATSKVRYLPGEAGNVRITLRNRTAEPHSLTVEAEIVQELARVTGIHPRQISLGASQGATIEIPFTAPSHEYGAALQVRVVRNGAVVARSREMFAVARNLWNVAIGSNLTIMDMSGRPWQDADKDLRTARERYFNWWEKMFWAPDDWGNLTPVTDSWFSGQGGRYEIKRVIKDFNRRAREQGIASITYGKSVGGGPAGWELARVHPEWYIRDASGRIAGTYDTDLFAHWDTLPKQTGRPWHFLFPDLTRLDALDHGIEELANSALEYGWEGVRFDGDFGSVGDDGTGARNQRRMKERIWSKLPGFVFGFNGGFGPPESAPSAWPHAVREGLAGGGHWMNEGIGGNDYHFATNGTYATYGEYWSREGASADRLRQIGASYHFIYRLPAGVSGQYKFILGTSAGAHPVYGESATAAGCANWGRFLTRWSAFVWDVNLRNRPDTDAEVDTPVPLWHAVKERVADQETATTIVHLLVPPTIDDPRDARVRVGSPATGTVVKARIAASETIVRVASISPEHPEEPLLLPFARQGDWVIATIPVITTWTMVIFERDGQFVLPSYPRFTEPATGPQVGRDQLNGYLDPSRDPLRPAGQSKINQPVRTLELARLYQTQAIVEPDSKTSSGYSARIDYRMANSSIITHAIFPEGTPGRYRATYRLRLKSRIDDAGKPVWAGFGLYVTLGKKSLWLREIGPGDFKTPGRYEDFAVEFDSPGESSSISVGAFWRGQNGGGTVHADRITLERMTAFSDLDLATRLGSSRRGAGRPGSATELNVLVVNGLYHQFYRVQEALALIGSAAELAPLVRPQATNASLDAAASGKSERAIQVRYATVSVGETAAVLTGFPQDPLDLWQFNVVVLINVDAAWLRFTGRAMLRDFVESGGGLLVLGGGSTLGQGNFSGTYLADLLPAEIASSRDVLRVGSPSRIEVIPGGDVRDPMSGTWRRPAHVFWQHKIKPRSGAQVRLLAGGEPILLTGNFGSGRVALFAGTVLGVPKEAEQPFWETADWPMLVRNMTVWLGAK